MIIAVSVGPESTVGEGWGRAHDVAIADVQDGAIVTWEDHAVAWDIAHDEGTEGSHHARIAKFLREYKVEAVVTGHMGDGMVRMLGTMGIAANLGMTGDAKAAAVAAAR